MLKDRYCPEIIYLAYVITYFMTLLWYYIDIFKKHRLVDILFDLSLYLFYDLIFKGPTLPILTIRFPQFPYLKVIYPKIIVFRGYSRWLKFLDIDGRLQSWINGFITDAKNSLFDFMSDTLSKK